MKTFNQVMRESSDKLKLYVPIVARVHGKDHPEFYKVQKVYERIVSKIEDPDAQSFKLDEEFADLRQITNDYSIPKDVCESYEAVYQMLFALDQAYKT